MRGNLQVKFGGRRASTQPYEYSDYNSSDEQSLTFDSYTIPEDDPELGQSRLLEVDNRVVVPERVTLNLHEVHLTSSLPYVIVIGGEFPHYSLLTGGFFHGRKGSSKNC